MKILFVLFGSALYVLVMYSINTYLYDSLDTFDELNAQHKRSIKYVPGRKSENSKKLIDFAKFYKEAVDQLVPKLTPEEQKELNKWSNEHQIIKRAKQCDTYFKTFSPIIFDETIKKFEKAALEPFNLAFVHHIQKDIAIYESFLSLYFRPNNFYCIHLDKRADEESREALELLINCYSKKVDRGKIILLKQNESYEVTWGGDALVRADLDCMEKLLTFNSKKQNSWKYVSMSSGNELPLVTYLQYHQELAKNLKGDKSAVESVPVPNMQILDRLTPKQRADCSNCPEEIKTKAYNASWKPLVAKSPVQFSIFGSFEHSETSNIQIFKGIRNVILSVKDAEFIVHNKISKTFMRWQTGGQFTDEHFYSTLIRIQYDKKENSIFQDKGSKNDVYLHNICPRYTPWYFGPRMGTKNVKRKACFGKYELGLCTFKILDLSGLYDPANTCLTATRFSLETDSSAVLIHLINLMGKSFLQTKTATQKVKDHEQGPEQRFVKRIYDKLNNFLLY